MFRTATHGNGVITTFNADPNLMGRPSSITAQYGTTTYWNSGAYAYDGAGNIKSIGTNTYKYDSLSRLLEGTVGANKQVHTYDPYGNMTRMMTYLNGVLNVDNTMNVSTATNRLPASGGSIFGTYDSAGNQLTKNTGYTYTYDAFNMMTSRVEPGRDLTFVYTADDERIWEFNYLLSRGDYTIRDLDHKVLRVIREDSFATQRWSWKEDYIHRGSTLLSQSSPTGIVHLHVDHLGTPRWISNASRGQVGLHAYYPFGIESTSQGQNTIERKFTSHERDTDFGGNVDYLDYMHARYYSPVMGRFLSVDPVLDLKQAMRNPQGWNRYAYVFNNPIRFTDPTGQYVCSGTKEACATIEIGIQKIRDSAAAMKKNNPKRAELQQVIDAYGKVGDATTRIRTVWVNPMNSNGTPVLPRNVMGQVGRDGLVAVSLINIAAKAGGDGHTAFTMLGGTLTHEGKHQLQPAVVSLQGRPSLLSLLHYELQAYTLEKTYYGGLGEGGMAPDPTKGAWGSASTACQQVGCNP